jgi:hypothetical protein
MANPRPLWEQYIMTDALNIRHAHIAFAGTALTIGVNPNFTGIQGVMDLTILYHAHATRATALVPFGERAVPINAELQACLTNCMNATLTDLQARTTMARHMIAHLGVFCAADPTLLALLNNAAALPNHVFDPFIPRADLEALVAPPALGPAHGPPPPAVAGGGLPPPPPAPLLPGHAAPVPPVPLPPVAGLGAPPAAPAAPAVPPAAPAAPGPAIAAPVLANPAPLGAPAAAAAAAAAGAGLLPAAPIKVCAPHACVAWVLLIGQTICRDDVSVCAALWPPVCARSAWLPVVDRLQARLLLSELSVARPQCHTRGACRGTLLHTV